MEGFGNRAVCSEAGLPFGLLGEFSFRIGDEFYNRFWIKRCKAIVIANDQVARIYPAATDLNLQFTLPRSAELDPRG